jgi:hypothetical protein
MVVNDVISHYVLRLIKLLDTAYEHMLEKMLWIRL